LWALLITTRAHKSWLAATASLLSIAVKEACTMARTASLASILKTGALLLALWTGASSCTATLLWLLRAFAETKELRLLLFKGRISSELL